MAALTDDLQWVNDDLPSEQFDNKVQDVAIRTARGQLTVLDLVKALGAQLTTDSAARRGRAVLLLAGVVQSLPSLTEAEANVLTAFFAAKLADWEVVGVGFKGCLALLAGPDGQARLASKDAVAVARSLLDNVHVPQLGITDRKEGLQLLLALLQLHGPALVEAEVDMIEGVLASVDGEKDPRCLLLAFQAVRAVVTLYSTTTPAALAALQKSAEEFGDMLSCYFPIMFKPPPNSAHAITREDLAGELERTMAASALLAPHVLPLLLEKLASSLMQSKKDALSALVACTRGYGAKGIGPYFSSIWSAIRNELLFSEDDSSASPRPRPQPSSTAPEASQGQSVAEQAADCLAACIGALEAAGNRDLVTLALRDASLEGMFADEADLGLGAGLASWDLALANCLKNARLYAAVARGSAFACKVLGSQVLPRLLKSASRAQDASPSARVVSCMALAALQKLVQAACALSTASAEQAQPAEPAEPSSSASPIAGFGAQLLAAACSSAQAAGTAQAAGLYPEADVDTEGQAAQQPISAAAVRELQAALLAQLLAFPAACSVLTSDQQAQALRALLLQLDQDNSAARTADAVGKTLVSMAAAGYDTLLAQIAVPYLLQAATAIPSDGASPYTQQPVLRMLAGIAVASATVRAAILPDVATLLPTALAAAAGSIYGQGMFEAFAEMLAGELLPRLAQPFGERESRVVQGMVADVLTGTATLAKAGKVLPASSVHSAARLVQMATSGCAAGSHSSISQQAALLVSEASQALAPTHQTANALDPTQGLFGQTAVVAAAAVAGLQPTAVPAGAAQELVGELLGLVHRLREPMDAECAAVAAAALLAKLPAGSPELDAAVEGSLSPVPGSAAAGPAHTARGFMALAWVTKALAMRGDARAEQGVHAALRFLAAAAAPHQPQPTTSGRPAEDVSLKELAEASTVSTATTSRPPQHATPLRQEEPGMSSVPRANQDPAVAAAEPIEVDAESMAEDLAPAVDTKPPYAGGCTGPSATLQAAVDDGIQKLHMHRGPDGGSSGGGGQLEAVQAAAALFGTVLSESGGPVLLQTRAHVKGKMLWQQRFFTTTLDQLLAQLQQQAQQARGGHTSAGAAGAAGAARATSGQSPGGSHGPNGAVMAFVQEANGLHSPMSTSQQAAGTAGTARPPALLLALAQLVRGAPSALVRGEAARLLPWLLDALSGLQDGPLADQALLKAVLEAVSESILDKQGQAAVEQQVARVIDMLCQLARYKPSADTRETALRCLSAIMQLPYTLLHPHRKAVLQSIAQALDDPKRSVRQQAVRCRRAWSSA